MQNIGFNEKVINFLEVYSLLEKKLGTESEVEKV